MINRPFDPECRKCAGTGYIDYYTAHLDYEIAERCDCDTTEPRHFEGDHWLDGARVIPAKFHGPLLVPINVKQIVIHCGNTGSDDFGAYFKNPVEFDSDGKKRWRVVSAHFGVLDSGRVEQYVPINRVAWGAQGHNFNSIHIEMQGPHTRKDRPAYVVDNIAKVIRACCEVYPIETVRSHRSIAPLRRKDPGKHFPWPALGSQLLGLVVVP